MDILQATSHRPYPLPSKRWILKQNWRNVSFIHWRVAPQQLHSLIPKQLEIDTYHGHAWISVIVFDMQKIQLRGFPKVSLTPSFSEINVRTYVTYNGIPGIYFLSINVDDWASNTIAKRWYRLPYRPASISLEKSQQSYHYECIQKNQTHMKGEGSITPFDDIYTADKDSLDYWLMERYRLYSVNKHSHLYKADIHHKPWPLQKAETDIYRNNLITHINLHGINPTVSHFSKGVDTLFWQVAKV